MAKLIEMPQLQLPQSSLSGSDLMSILDLFLKSKGKMEGKGAGLPKDIYSPFYNPSSIDLSSLLGGIIKLFI